jgi:DNA-directed RNA polymerase I subunit RPA34.5
VSARKSSTVYPFSYHASEKAENCTLVRYARVPCVLCWLWSQKKAITSPVQKPITRHLVVSARPAKPTRPEVAYEAHKREAYPDEALKHRFRPYGDPGDLPREDRMDVDVVEASPKEKKEKIKRKASGETGSPKKRKTKLAAS